MNDLLPETMIQPQLRLHLLGSPRVMLDGRNVTGFKSAKAQAVLYYVAVSRSLRSRPELAAIFWPEVSEKRANTSLRTALSNLRRLVGDHLEITRKTVALDPSSNIVLDVTQFDTLLKRGIGEAPDILQIETAVSLYDGDFLEGFHLPDAPLFEQWATTEGTRLRGALLGALHTLALWHAERSEYQASLDYLARLLALDPIREVGHRLKMAVLALSGQRGAALAHFDVSRRIRSEQLGLDPTPETIALYELILHDRFPGESQPAISELIADTQSRGIDSSVASELERPKRFGQAPSRKIANVDWGDMPDRADLIGRRRQLSQLVQWLTIERSRLVAIVGIGGVGKTTLAAEVTRLMASYGRERPPGMQATGESEGAGEPPFDRIIWRSLVNLPPITDILNDWLQLLPDKKPSRLPDTLEARLSLLLKELQDKRCLLILDNAESVLQQDNTAGPTELTQDAYLQLFRQIANSDHQSCLLLTSREAPPRVRQMAGEHPKIELLQLEGLPATAGADLLRFRGLDSSPERLESIVARYSGNPLALKLVAETVRELFAGDVGEFLHDETLIFADLREVLDQQFGRLSELEQEILTWLAIEREPVPAQVLSDDLVHAPHRRQFLEALRSLRRRSMIERSSRPDEDAPARFALQNVVMEYLTSRLVETVCQELESGELSVVQRYALVKAHTREYVEDSQRRLLLKPVAGWLIARLGAAGAVDRLRDLLDALHDQAPRTPGYAGANILHLLVDMDVDLSGYDFSNLAIWQVDLRNVSLFDVSFKSADLQGSLFRDTFGLVITVAISPDGQLLAAGSSEGAITLWELNQYQPRLSLKEHSGHINCIAFSHDGRLLASASFDQTIRLWDVHTGRSLHELTGHAASVLSVTFSPDGETLFSGGEDQSIRVWDVRSGLMRGRLADAGDRPFFVAVSPDGQSLASGGLDGFVCLVELATGRLKVKVPGHDGKIRSVVFSPDGTAVATAGEDHQIHLWHARDLTRMATLTGHENWVLSIAFSPDGRKLASASADKTIRLWDIMGGRTRRVLSGYKNWVTSVAFSPDGELVAGGSYDRRIRLWEVSSGRLVHTLRGSLRWVDQVIFSPDDKLLASATFDKPILLWDVQRGELGQRLRGHSGSVRCFAFSPNGQVLAGGSDDHTVRLWDVRTGSLRMTLSGHEGFVRTLAFSPDGQSLATGDMEGNLHVWQIPGGRSLFSWPDASLGLKYSICFSPGGQLLAFGCLDHTIRLVDMATGHTRATLSGHQAPVQLVRFSPDGSLLASRAKDGAVRVWNVEKSAADAHQSDFQWPTSSDFLWNIAISPDGSLLAAQLEDDAVGVLDLKSGRLRHTIRQYLLGEGCLEFTRDGAFLITGDSSGLVQLWGTSSGELWRTLAGHEAPVTSIALSGHGQHVASSSADGQIRVWDIENGACLKVMKPPGPYVGMDINGAIGLTPAQTAALQALGAVSGDNLG